MSWLVKKAAAFDWATALTPNDTTTGDTDALVNNVITIIIWIAGALAVIYLVYSGILYITAAGNPDQAKKGQQGVINAIIGIVIIVAAYFIINVAVDLGNDLTYLTTYLT